MGGRSGAEPRFRGSASVDGLQRAIFRGLLRWSRLPALRLGGLRLEPLAEPLLEPSQTGPKLIHIIEEIVKILHISNILSYNI